jgi:hypothetical protein
MSEQTVAPKVERSSTYQSCRLGYDCLMASTKSFVHNFSLLSDEEKAEFKSLNTYVKQLDKCMSNLRNNVHTKASSAKRVQKPAQAVSGSVTETQEASVTGPVVSKAKGGKAKKASGKTEQSPTAQEVAAIHTEASAKKEAAPVTSSSAKKGAATKKAAVPTEAAAAVTAAPVTPVVAKKPAATKKAAAPKKSA